MSGFDLLKYIFISIMALFPLLLGLIFRESNVGTDITFIVALVFCLIGGFLAVTKGFMTLIFKTTDLSLDQTIMFILAGIVCIIFGATVFLVFFPSNPILLTAFEFGRGFGAILAGVAFIIGILAFGRKRG